MHRDGIAALRYPPGQQRFHLQRLADFRDLSAFASRSMDFVFATDNVIDALPHAGRLCALQAKDGARELHHSLRRLLELPDGVEVYPGHVAGSLCGAAMSSKASTTIGFERRFNRMLAAADEDEFVHASTDVRAPRPPNLDRISASSIASSFSKPTPTRKP